MTFIVDSRRRGLSPIGPHRLRLAAVFAVAGLVAAACAGDNSSSRSGPPNPTASSTTSVSALPVDTLRAIVNKDMHELNVPGAVVLVSSPEGEWLQAFGTRTVDGGDAVTTDDSFRVGSITKTMTGTIVLQLAQEGKLELDDPVSKYWPGIPNGDTITIADLLEMRSGLKSYTHLLSINQLMDEDPARTWTSEELVQLGVAEPADPPGAAYEYSNTNTVLAGLIAEKVAGEDIVTLFNDRIFGPLGMKHTVMPPITSSALPDPHPHGYMYGTAVSTLNDSALPADQQEAARAGTLKPNDYTNLNPSWAGMAGAVSSTAGDMGIYIKALATGGLLNASFQKQRLDSIQPIDPTQPQGAGYGLAIASLGPLLGHTGSLPGFQAFAGHDPQRDLTVVVLANLQTGPDGRASANTIAQDLAKALYSGAPTAADVASAGDDNS
jgi:D-alanyl-D-alanine carboxypeptidase